MAPRPTNEDIYEKLGGLGKMVERLAIDLSEMKQDISRTETRASDSRSRLHEKIETLANRISAVESVAISHGDILVDVKGVTDEVKLWKQRGIGGLFVTGIASSAVTAAVVKYWDVLTRVFRGTT